MDDVEIIIGVDNPNDVKQFKLLTGKLLTVEEVKEKLKGGQKFSSLVVGRAGLVPLEVQPDGVLSLIDSDGNKTPLERIPPCM